MQFVKGFFNNKYFRNSTNSLPVNQVEVDNIFALDFRNLLIIIILASYSAGIFELVNSFFFSGINSLSAGFSK